MANQMIALQARGPQLPNLAGAAAQYGNMMANMAVMKEKQASIQRAYAFRQLVSDPGFDPSNPEHIKAAQSLDPAGAEKIVSAADARRKANLEYIGQLTQQFRDQLAVIDPNDKVAYGALREEIVKAVPGWGSRLPTAEQWGPDARVRTLMKADDVISKTIATPTASFQVSDTGVPQSVTVGGLAPSVQEMPQYRYQPDQPPAPAAAQTAAPAELTPQEAGPILQNATQTQTISEQDAARVRRSLGPQGQPQFDRWLQTNSIQVIPMAYIGNAGEMSPPMRTAEYREPVRDYFSNPGVADYPVENAPVNPLRQDIGYVPTTTRFKSPMQSPTPGSANVPLPRVEGEAAASEGGRQGVRVVTEPQIAAGTAAATNKVELQKNLPKARGALNLAIAQLDRDIADIDYVLRNPYREMVVGKIEGRLPSAVNMFRGIGSDIDTGQQAQNVQDRLDKIGAKSVVTHLQQMHEASPQGSSLFGQVTEYEDRLVKALAGLEQTQDEGVFDNALREYRKVLVEMRQNLPAVFNETFGPVGGRAQVGTAPAAPRNTPTRADVEYLLRNRNRPSVVNGFRQHFGDAAFRQAIGGR